MPKRVDREKEAYNSGLKRKGYHHVFRHCDYQYKKKRSSLISDFFANSSTKDVLEIGSQSWRYVLEQNGIDVKSLVCINISEKELQKGKKHTKSTILSPQFILMDAHQLSFPDNSFDIVFGSNILHHLDMELVLPEMLRVLRPGGKVFFREPLDFNPLGKLVRVLTPQARTPDERPFRQADIDLLSRYFSCSWYYEQFFSVPFGVISGLINLTPDNALTRFSFNLDEFLLRAIPSLGKWYRYVTFTSEVNQ